MVARGGARATIRVRLVAIFALVSIGSGADAAQAAGVSPAPLPIVPSQPAITDLAPGDAVTNRLKRLAPARRPRPKSLAELLGLLFGVGKQVIGPEVAASAYPWQVALRITANGDSWRCGGILISPNFVLTAAHCLDAADVSVRAKIWRVRGAQIEVFHGHREYARGGQLPVDSAWGPLFHTAWKDRDDQVYAGDAALIHLAWPLTTGTFAPLQVAVINPPRAVVSGWGRFDGLNIESPALRAATLPLIDDDTCMSHLAADRRYLMSGTSLCSESNSRVACKGDSGGPLVIGSRLHPQTIGIVSWGIFEECGRAGSNGTLIAGYTRASAIADWVRTVTGDAQSLTSAPPDALFDVQPISVGGGPDR